MVTALRGPGTDYVVAVRDPPESGRVGGPGILRNLLCDFGSRQGRPLQPGRVDRQTEGSTWPRSLECLLQTDNDRLG